MLTKLILFIYIVLILYMCFQLLKYFWKVTKYKKMKKPKAKTKRPDTKTDPSRPQEGESTQTIYDKIKARQEKTIKAMAKLKGKTTEEIKQELEKRRAEPVEVVETLSIEEIAKIQEAKDQLDEKIKNASPEAKKLYEKLATRQQTILDKAKSIEGATRTLMLEEIIAKLKNSEKMIDDLEAGNVTEEDIQEEVQKIDKEAEDMLEPGKVKGKDDIFEDLNKSEINLRKIDPVFMEKYDKVKSKIWETKKIRKKTDLSEIKKNVNEQYEKGCTTEKHCPQVLKGFILPGLPHPLLKPNERLPWKKLREAYNKVSREVYDLNPDLILIYSTYWASVLGHQIQAHPKPQWILVDDEWHSLGSIPYEFQTDVDFAGAYNQANKKRGLKSRLTAYEGFPIDTGSVVCLKLIDPETVLNPVLSQVTFTLTGLNRLFLVKGPEMPWRHKIKKLWFLLSQVFLTATQSLNLKNVPMKFLQKKMRSGIKNFWSFWEKAALKTYPNSPASFTEKPGSQKKWLITNLSGGWPQSWVKPTPTKDKFMNTNPFREQEPPLSA